MKRELIAVSATAFVAQLAAYAKLLLMARLFGVGAELDGYYLGFVIPSLIVGVLGGVLQVSLVPLHAEHRVKSDDAGVRRFERVMLLAVAGSCGTIGLLLFLGADLLVPFLSGASTEAVRDAVSFVLPIAALAVFVNGIGDYLCCLLAIYNRYAVACAASIANALVGAVLLAAWPEGGLLNLTAGTILGSAVQGAICFFTAMRHGFRPFGALQSGREALATVSETLRSTAWTIPGMIFSNLTLYIPPVMIARYGEGAVAAFGYAFRLHTAVALLLAAGAPVMLARFAALRAQGETEVLRRVLRQAGWISALFGILAIVAVWMFGTRIVELLFASGRFDASAAARTAEHWSWLTLGLGFYVWGVVISKYLQADRRPAVLAIHAALVFFLFWSASRLFTFLDEYSVSAAFSLAAVLYGVLLHVLAQFGLTGTASRNPLGKFYR